MKPDREAQYLRQIQAERKRADDLLNVVVPVAISLSVERDFDRLLERILVEATSICNADAGTLYLRTADDQLQFMIVRTASLNLALGGTSGSPIPYPPLRLYEEGTRKPNHHNVATYTALSGTTVNIPDVYDAEGFDFSGTAAFDRLTGYRSTSLLTIPLKRGPDRVIGVIQLLNAQDRETGQVIPFDQTLQPIVEALASLAAIALASYQREDGLRQKIRQLRVAVDQTKKVRQVAEITDTEYFQQLRQQVRNLKRRSRAKR